MSKEDRSKTTILDFILKTRKMGKQLEQRSMKLKMKEQQENICKLKSWFFQRSTKLINL